MGINLIKKIAQLIEDLTNLNPGVESIPQVKNMLVLLHESLTKAQLELSKALPNE